MSQQQKSKQLTVEEWCVNRGAKVQHMPNTFKMWRLVCPHECGDDMCFRVVKTKDKTFYNCRCKHWSEVTINTLTDLENACQKT